METKYKTFHFQEIGWFINFSPVGNTGKYSDYEVVLATGQGSGTGTEKRLRLGEALSKPEFEENYPHTVGYFKVFWGEECPVLNRAYLEIRQINSIEEFWAFLNAMNL